MKKMNRKGFTLVEMLVVIAIIAILVAVIIPTVSSSTSKAKAATDAANLRSAKAAATISALDGKTSAADLTAEKLGVPANSKYDGGAFSCTVDTTNGGITVTVKYGDNGIDYYAEKAGNSESGGASTTASGSGH